jgi:hypothetical protein
MLIFSNKADLSRCKGKDFNLSSHYFFFNNTAEMPNEININNVPVK